MIQSIKKAAAVAATATLEKLQTSIETSFATVRKAATNCKISDISASVALMLALTAIGFMEWHPVLALMLLIPAVGMAIALRASTQCSTFAVKSRADSAHNLTDTSPVTGSPAPSMARRSSRWTGRTFGGDCK